MNVEHAAAAMVETAKREGGTRDEQIALLQLMLAHWQAMEQAVKLALAMMLQNNEVNNPEMMN